MTPDVADFPSLIRWLADTYHRGKFYPIAKRADISNAIIDKWRHGVVASPRIDSIDKLCDAYDLDFIKVLMMFRTKPGKGRRRRRTAAILLALGLAFGSVPASALQAAPEPVLDRSASYRKRRWLEIIHEVRAGWREIVHAPSRRAPQLWDLPALPAMA